MPDGTENAPQLRGVFYDENQSRRTGHTRLATYGAGGSSHSPCHRVSA